MRVGAPPDASNRGDLGCDSGRARGRVISGDPGEADGSLSTAAARTGQPFDGRSKEKRNIFKTLTVAAAPTPLLVSSAHAVAEHR